MSFRLNSVFFVMFILISKKFNVYCSSTIRIGYFGNNPSVLLSNSSHVECHHLKNWSELIDDCASFNIIWLNHQNNCLTKYFYNIFRERCYKTILLFEHNIICERPSTDIGLGIPLHESLNLNLFLDILQQFQSIHRNGQTRQFVQHVAILHDHNSQIGNVSELNHFVRLIENKSYKIESKRNLKNLKKENSLAGKVTEFRVSPGTTLKPVLDHLTQFNIDISQQQTLTSIEQRKIIVIAISNLELVIGVIRNLRRLSGKHPLGDNNKWLLLVPKNVEWPEEIYSICNEIDGIFFIEFNTNFNNQMNRMKCSNIYKQIIERSIHKVFVQLQYRHQPKSIAKNRLLSELRLQFDSFEHCETSKIFSFIKHRINDRLLSNGFTQFNTDNTLYKNDRQVYATWHPVRGLRIKRQLEHFGLDFTNFRDRPLRIGIGWQELNMRIKEDPTAKNGFKLEGITYEMILVLASKLNFTPQFIVADFYLDKTQWPSELVDKVSVGELDMGGSSFHKTLRRSRRVRMSVTYEQTQISILMKKNKEDMRYLFLSPFTWDAWLFIVCIVAGMGPVLWLINRSSFYYKYYKTNYHVGLFRMSNCVWYCFGAIVQQGGDHLPCAISGRILITFWWLFVIVTVTTYSGNLVALLTFPKIFNPINDINDLLQYRNRLRIFISQNSVIAELFENSPSLSVKEIKQSYEFFSFNRTKEVLNLIKEGKAVMLDANFNIRGLIYRDFTQNNKCELALARESVFSSEMGFIFNPNLPKEFLKKMNYEILRMAKTGLVSLWRRKYELKGNDCLNPLLIRSGSIKKIEMEHLFDCFFLLILGLFIAGIFFIVEKLIQHKNKLKRKKILHLWQKILTAGRNARKMRIQLWNKFLTSTKVLNAQQNKSHELNEHFDSEKNHSNECVNYTKSHHFDSSVNTLAQLRRSQKFQQHYHTVSHYRTHYSPSFGS